jgi:hypothetical protein
MFQHMQDILDVEVALLHPLPDMSGWNASAFLKEPMDGRLPPFGDRGPGFSLHPLSALRSGRAKARVPPSATGLTPYLMRRTLLGVQPGADWRVDTRKHATASIIGETKMGEKLQQGDRFPSLTLKLVLGGTIRLPDEMPTRYAAVLFYRGHW